MSGPPSDTWSAAHWCRENAVRPGSVVGAAGPAAGFSFEAYRVTHVGGHIVVGACVGTVYPHGRRGCGPPVVEASGDYEMSWGYGSQLFAPADGVLDAVVAWLERPGD